MVRILRNKSRFLLSVELLVALVALGLPLTLRYWLESSGSVEALQELGQRAVLYAILYGAAIFMTDLYQVQIMASRRRLMPRLAKACLLTLALYAGTAALLPDQLQGRVVFVVSVVLFAVLLLALHFRLRPTLQSRSFREQVLILGEGPLANSLREELKSTDYHQQLIEDPELESTLLQGIIRLGRSEEGDALRTQLEQIGEQVDLIILAQEEHRWPSEGPHAIRPWPRVHPAPRMAGEVIGIEVHRRWRSRAAASRAQLLPSSAHGYTLAELIRGVVMLRASELPVMSGVDYFEQLTGRLYLGRPEDPLFFTRAAFKIDKLGHSLKAAWEWVLALVIFVCAIPTLIGVPLAIWLDTGRPLLFVQPRVGRFGRVYNLFKWRSMDDQGNVTRVGRIIRKTKLDEFPQLINVLRGQMALVGPRPEMPHFVEQFDGRSEYYALRHMVRPGLSGWAQVMFPDAKAEDALLKLSYDLYYVRNFSLINDLVIMAETLKLIVFGGMARAMRDRQGQEQQPPRAGGSTQ